MKTLVIHPKDSTTDFLSVIYSDKKDWTVVTTFTGKSKLVEQIKSHDRIIMLGHGTEYGLLGGMGFVINPSLVYLLKEKDCVCIWCNADVFVEKYNLKGFYTGMIISEFEEALLYCVSCYYNQISESNILFADSVKKSITSDNMLQEMVDTYKSDENPVIQFNCANMYFKN
jgi:hypothetical protein